ncbi:bifunctional riboflavin kinase/FAD synthetase [soil metagenome]
MPVTVPAGEFPANLRGGVVAIGNFDGVHRGHQMLLGVARDKAHELKRPWGLVTFEPHPRSFFRPAEPVFTLTPLRLKARLVAALGAQFVTALTFDAGLAAMSPDDFVRRELAERFGVVHVVTGYDFHFGHGRRGTTETMREAGKQLGFGVSVIDQVTDDDGLAPFASSAIRDALRHGHPRDAGHELGYWWTVVGVVVEGDKRGRTIGFPTANIRLEGGAEPFEGIYAMRVRDLDTGGRYHGAGYIGKRPTFDTNVSFLEVHLLGFNGDLYGHTMMVEIVDLIRPDKKFNSVDELVTQMKRDCDSVRIVLDDLQKNDPLTEYPLGRLQSAGKI